jgi:uncharacterized repeat protein (TIGR01451 family)
MNLIKGGATGKSAPALSIEVREPGQNGKVLYSNALGKPLPQNYSQPEWIEAGDIFHTGDVDSVVVRFVSQGPGGSGNDYAIDDVSLTKVTIPRALTPTKTAEPTTVDVGDTVTYTITAVNNFERAVEDAYIQDTLPNGLSFVDGSVTVNGVADAGANPTTALGHSIGTVNAGDTVTLTFKARVDSPPNPNPAQNIATSSYKYSLIKENPATPQTTKGQPSSLIVYNNADITAEKASDKKNYLPGNTVTYTININNAGPARARTPKIEDTFPGTLQNPEFSTDNGTTWNPWTGSTTLPNIDVGGKATVLLRGVVAEKAIGSLANTATITSPTLNLDGGPTSVTASTRTSPDGNPSVLDTADLKATKTSDKKEYNPGAKIEFTVELNNAGPAAAKGLSLEDTIPSQIEKVEYSIDGGEWLPWEASSPSGATGSAPTTP